MTGMSETYVLIVMGLVIAWALIHLLALSIQVQRGTTAVEAAAAKQAADAQAHNELLMTALGFIATAVKTADRHNEEHVTKLSKQSEATRTLIARLAGTDQRRQEMQIDLMVQLVEQMHGLRQDLRTLLPNRLEPLPKVTVEGIRRELDRDRAPSIAAQALQALLQDAAVSEPATTVKPADPVPPVAPEPGKPDGK